MGSQFPAVVSQALCDCGRLFAVLLVIGIGVLIRFICPVSKNSIVARKCDNGSCALIRKSRVFFNEGFQYGNEIEISGDDASVILFHLCGGIAVFPDHHAGGEAVSLHIFIVAHVILRHDEGLFPFGKHDVAVDKLRIAVFVCRLMGEIMDLYENVALIVHGLHHLDKLVFRRHHLVVSALPVVSVEGFGGIDDQRVEEHVGDFLGIDADQPAHLIRVGGDGVCGFLRGGVAAVGGDQIDGAFIIVLQGQAFRLCKEIDQTGVLCLRRRGDDLRRGCLRSGLGDGCLDRPQPLAVPAQYNAARD